MHKKMNSIIVKAAIADMLPPQWIHAQEEFYNSQDRKSGDVTGTADTCTRRMTDPRASRSVFDDQSPSMTITVQQSHFCIRKRCTLFF